MAVYDLIHFENTLMVIAENGLYQYDYSKVEVIKLLSKLSIATK